MLTRAFLVIGAMLLAACSSSDDPNPVTMPAAEIAWHQGVPADAFAQAEIDKRPLFLYWGASWCPYCKQIEATVFTRRDVIDRLQQFIAVKLDGDAPDAQKLGEEFRVYGYPTMIVFAPSGDELTRVPNGMNPEAYADVLDIALETLTPLSEILNDVLAGKNIGDRDWQRLSTYSWQQDNNRVLSGLDLLDTMTALSERCPESAAFACSRLYFSSLAEQVDRVDTRPLKDDSKQLAYRRLLELNTDPLLAAHNIDTLLHSSPGLLRAVTDAGSDERSKLRDELTRAVTRLANDPAQSIVDRLYASYVPVGLWQVDGASVPEKHLESLRENIDAAIARTLDSNERHAVVVTAGKLLAQSDLVEDAEKLLRNELPKSDKPFYLMSILASIAETRDEKAEALQWRRKAYESSVGTSTRFRWGYNYVMAVLRMSPDDVPGVEMTTTAMFQEFDTPATAFYGGTYSRAGNLSEAIVDWADSPERGDAVTRIAAAVSQVCEKIPDGQIGRQRCDSLFDDAGGAEST